MENLRALLDARYDLHNFVNNVLNELDFHWNSDDEILSFFDTFFRMMELLIRRKFFHPKYNKWIKAVLSQHDTSFDPASRVRSNPKVEEFPNYIKKLIDEDAEEDDKGYYLYLKFSLIEKLSTTRPQYFEDKDMKKTESSGAGIKSLADRFDCLTSTSNLISKIKITVAKITYLIYDYYQAKTLGKQWKLYKKIMKGWVKKKKVKQPIVGIIGSFSKSSRSGKLGNKDEEQPFGGSEKEQQEDGADDGNEEGKENQDDEDDNNKEDGDEGDGDDHMKSQKSLKGSRSMRSGRENAEGDDNEKLELGDEEQQEAAVENINIVTFKSISESLKKDCMPLVAKFVKQYTSGAYDLKALGNVKKLEEDSLVEYLVDMLYYKNSKLTVESMNMLYRHFNQFATLHSAFKNCLLLHEQEEEETFRHIKRIKHRFWLIVDSLQLTEDESQLTDLLECFRTSKEQVTAPALIGLCYGHFWGFKCTMCGRWFRAKNESKTDTAEKVRELSENLANGCIRRHVKVYGEEETESKVPQFKPIGKDIVAKNQELMRKAKVHKTVLKFIRQKCYKISGAMRAKYKRNSLQLLCFKYCYEFLYYFILNHESNVMELTTKQNLNMFCWHLNYEELKADSLRLLHEIVSDNDQANNMLQEQIIKDLITTVRTESELLRVEIIRFLKDVAESDLGPKRNRQQLIIGSIKKFLSKGIKSQESEKFDFEDNAGNKSKNTPLDRFLLGDQRAEIISKVNPHKFNPPNADYLVFENEDDMKPLLHCLFIMTLNLHFCDLTSILQSSVLQMKS